MEAPKQPETTVVTQENPEDSKKSSPKVEENVSSDANVACSEITSPKEKASDISELEKPEECVLLSDCIVRKDVSVLSDIICNLKKGTQVLVTHKEGSRAHINQPVEGWCSVVKEDGEQILQITKDGDVKTAETEEKRGKNPEADVTESVELGSSEPMEMEVEKQKTEGDGGHETSPAAFHCIPFSFSPASSDKDKMEVEQPSTEVAQNKEKEENKPKDSNEAVSSHGIEPTDSKIQSATQGLEDGENCESIALDEDSSSSESIALDEDEKLKTNVTPQKRKMINDSPPKKRNKEDKASVESTKNDSSPKSSEPSADASAQNAEAVKESTESNQKDQLNMDEEPAVVESNVEEKQTGAETATENGKVFEKKVEPVIEKVPQPPEVKKKPVLEHKKLQISRKPTFSTFCDLSFGGMSDDSSSSEEEGEFGFRKLPYPKYDRSFEITSAFNSGIFGSFHRPKIPERPPPPVKKKSRHHKPRTIVTRSRKRSRQQMESESSSGDDGPYDPEIEDIMKKKRTNGKTTYLVRWTHLAHPRWETEERLDDHQRALRSFERRMTREKTRKRASGYKPIKKKRKIPRKETKKRKRKTSKARPTDRQKKQKIISKPRIPTGSGEMTFSPHRYRGREPSSGQLHISPERELPPNHPQVLELNKKFREDSKQRISAAASLYKTAQDIMAVLNPQEEKPITISGPSSTCKDYLEKVRAAFTRIIEPQFSMLFETNNRMKREISKFDSENRKLKLAIKAWEEKRREDKAAVTAASSEEKE